MLDADLGISGTQMNNRQDFKTLVADVSLEKVGAVFALEASRLSRSCSDWHRLLEICSLTGTLIVDADGCYDPADFNDQLLLGLKGTMSQAELHFLRGRLQGGKRNKAQRGELRFPLPVGFVYGEEPGSVLLDPDAEVQHAVRLVFTLFRQTGSAYGVVRHFRQHQLSFPRRAYGGAWNGKIFWGRLQHGRVLGLLSNPCYAGAYAFGRYRGLKSISTDGQIQSKIQKQPIGSWLVLIQEHHPGYLGWDEYLENQQMLEQNQTNQPEQCSSGAAREGRALLQGLLLCGHCGRRLSPRYTGNGGIHPVYECTRRQQDTHYSSACIRLPADPIDQTVGQRVLEILQPDQIEIAFRAVQELERRSQAVDQQWRMRLERLEYQAQLAQRRYEEVDPANRLVAATLEQRWNQALQERATAQEELNRQRQQQGLELTAEQKEPVAGFGQRPAPTLAEPLDLRPGPQADAAFAYQGHHGGKAGWRTKSPAAHSLARRCGRRSERRYSAARARQSPLSPSDCGPGAGLSPVADRPTNRGRAQSRECIERQRQALHAEHDQMDPVSARHPGAIIKAARGTDRRGSSQALWR